MVNDAVDVFVKFKDIGICPSIATWNSALLGCLGVQRTDLVWKLYHDMLESRVVADIETVEYLIRAFCYDGKFMKGYQLLRQVLEEGLVPRNIAFNALISGFCKLRNFVRVSELLHTMIAKNCAPDIYTYQEVINGLCKNKMLLNALRIFNDLKNRGYSPDRVMYTTMIHGLCEMGWICNARKLWFEFDSADDAREFYGAYAMRIGFRIRTGQLYRSRTDGSVSSRRFVCSKEGFQLNSRTGCPAFIRVQRRDSGKWVIDQIHKDHNHELGLVDEIHPPILQQRTPKAKKSSAENSDWSAISFKNDGSITSRRFVCSKEGFQHPSRVGCGAFMRIKRQESGTWIVDRLQKSHNHHLELQTGTQQKSYNTSKKFIDDANGDVNDGLDSVDIAKIYYGSPSRGARENNIGSDWYKLLLDYFQTRQAEDTGFFYSVEADNGSCMSVFWADGRSRFSCSQFGDAIVFDTSYRKSNYVVPFATLTWLRAMSGCRPKSIIADQDAAIQQAIAKVFPGTHHRFSMWQIRAKERENFRSMTEEFKYEYEKCIYQSQTSVDFKTMWSALINKYALKENAWLREMYEKRESWVPLYLGGKFCAGIPVSEGLESFFGTFLNAQTPLAEFISRYEQGLARRRDEERQEDFNCYNLQAFLHTKNQ
ncbi:hypothetical protein GH714_002791 [Hevea brasiliensis]|uniref:Protein FAR1-RELATED SEQUENCE n=1 Tax=Hevea brasiliensis TaxID=3981 RepID=A0A6A6KK65_HEVBR|nr:hypothetical protein GH714_002791 [Hevea brasiliensis]